MWFSLRGAGKNKRIKKGAIQDIFGGSFYTMLSIGFYLFYYIYVVG